MHHETTFRLAPRILAADINIRGSYINTGNTKPMQDWTLPRVTYVSRPKGSDAQRRRAQATRFLGSGATTQRCEAPHNEWQ